MTADTSRTGKPEAGDQGGSPVNTVHLDPISLAQALLDVEVANARVIDLTRRLTQLNARLIETTTELESLRIRHRLAEAELARISVRGARLAGRVAKGLSNRVRR